MHFFPYQEGRIEPAGKQAFAREPNGTFVLDLPVANQLPPGFTHVAGVITASNGFRRAAQRCSAAVDTPLAGTVVAGPSR